MELADTRPWEQIRDLVAKEARSDLHDFLASLSSTEVARAVSHLEAEERAVLMALLEPTDAAEVMTDVPEEQAVDLLADLTPASAAAIVGELRSDVKVDLIAGLGESEAEAILGELEESVAADVRTRSEYDAETAGGLMVTEFLAYAEHETVADVVDDLRTHGETYSDYNVQYTYVISAAGKLAGVLPVRSLLLAARNQSLSRLMISDPLRLNVRADLDELVNFFEDHGLLGVPVVDDGDRLVGVVHRREIQEAHEHHADKTYLESAGIVGGEEFRSMSMWSRSGRRLSWLSINILLNIMAASVIAAYEDTLTAVIALAVFLPIISDMSGCSGSQAVAVSIREMTLGLLKPAEMGRVLLAELRVGIVNGFALGALLGGAALLWKGNVWLSLVVGSALMLNTIVAVSIGGLVPLVLRRFGKDPALASGPILTTVTDMCGFFLVLSLATFALSKL